MLEFSSLSLMVLRRGGISTIIFSYLTRGKIDGERSVFRRSAQDLGGKYYIQISELAMRRQILLEQLEPV